MSRRPTISEQRWPNDPRLTAQACQWAGDVAVQVLDWTWRAFDRLKSGHLSKVDLTQPLEQIERSLAAAHYLELSALWAQETGGYSSITPAHEWPEMETRPSAPGKPPAYDFAFVYCENHRIAWPIEAKVVASVRSIAEYMTDVAKFTTGVAAPLSGEGGVIAYLLRGKETDFLAALESKLETPLMTPSASDLAARAHRMSQHDRATAPRLCLHHLVMLCRQAREP